MSLLEFQQRFSDEAACHAYPMNLRFAPLTLQSQELIFTAFWHLVSVNSFTCQQAKQYLSRVHRIPNHELVGTKYEERNRNYYG